MKPKSRQDILDTCQNNFYNYSTLSKFLIIISVLLSAATFATYICTYISPTLIEIVNGNIVGWTIVWRVSLAFFLYYVWKMVNIFFIAIGGYAICNEEGWSHMDFSIAWTDMYEYEKYFNNDEMNDENFDK